MNYFTMNSTHPIPSIGMGTNTFGKDGKAYMGTINHDTTELLSAIAAGYRMFDTAISYRNESVLGQALIESKMPRESFFITSKLPGKVEYMGTEEAIHTSIRTSLAALQTKTIDLFLIHHPWDNLLDMLRVWKVLESYVDQGVFLSIGVSNFNEEQLGYLLEHARIKPAINQIESHPGKWNHPLISYSMTMGVLVEAWGPLTRVSEEAKAILTSIGARYGKSWAQVVLRYQIQRGVIVIPKSHDVMRQKDNLNVFDFTLTDEEKEEIASV